MKNVSCGHLNNLIQNSLMDYGEELVSDDAVGQVICEHTNIAMCTTHDKLYTLHSPSTVNTPWWGHGWRSSTLFFGSGSIRSSPLSLMR